VCAAGSFVFWRLLLDASLLWLWPESAMTPVYIYMSECLARYCILYLQWVDDGMCTDWHDGVYCVLWSNMVACTVWVVTVGGGCMVDRGVGYLDMYISV
jgi:hypothetical protein